MPRSWIMSSKYFYISLGFVLPIFAHADVFDVLTILTDFFFNIIPILMSVAVLVFFWGIVKFISQAGDERAVEEGKGFIIYGLVGIFVIVTLWGIVGFLQESLGLGGGGAVSDAPTIQTNIP